MSSMSKTAERYAALYTQGRIDSAALDRAVAKGLITAAEAAEIRAMTTG